MARHPAIANRVRTLRLLAGEMTQAELGERIGVTRQTIAAIEAGKYSPTLEAAFRIAEVFGKRLDEVFCWLADGGEASAAWRESGRD
ncbi:MAG: helix-turn-helix transcriptional regulator [Planctomycetes bacterium]|nr:helix-turn-helix transcriptional regulator [Planctomycetota bacterium]